MKRKALTLFLVVALLSSPMLVAAASAPDVNVYVPDRTVQPGQTQQLTLQIVNEPDSDGQQVRAAQAVNVHLKTGDTPIAVETGAQYLGSLPAGEVKTTSMRVTVPTGTDAGTYELPVTITYKDNGEKLYVERTAKVRVESQPRFEIVNTSTTAPVGGKGTVSVTVENVGDEAADEAVATLTSTSGDVTFGQSTTARRFVGEWEPGDVRTVVYDATVSSDADTRNYTMQASIAYQDSDGIAGASRNLSFGVTPLAEQTFAVDNVTSSLSVGQRGTLSGTVTNTGTLTARNAVIVFQSDDRAIQPVGSEYAIGTLEPGESRDFSFDVRVNGSTDAGPRQFSVLTRYRNADGDRVESRPTDVRARVEPQRPEFDVRSVESTLRVGEKGTISGEVVNTGDRPVTNAVISFEGESNTLTPVENEYAVGDLAAGEAASFSFDADVSESADAGPRQFSFRVRYRNADNVEQRSGSIDVRTDVAEKAPEFRVERVNSTVAAGGSGELRLRVTNTRDEEFSDISAKIYTESPLTSPDSEAYIESLAPGETKEIAFSVAAGGSAMEKDYPVKLDFEYDDESGDTAISDTYQVPVSVTRDGGGGVSLPIVGVVALLAVGGGLVYYRRR